ncbi:MAG: DUF47 domain-containing protein [Clostridium sp.]
MFNLNPKEDKFYLMFVEVSEVVNEAAVILRNGMEDLANKNECAEKVSELEHKGDMMVRHFIEELNKSFITPIDREDLYLIIKMADDVLDYIDSIMHRFIMFNVDKSTVKANSLCDMIVKLTGELVDLMNEFKHIGKQNKIIDKVRGIKEIEREADCIYRDTVSELFKNESDVLYILKWREIYELLENTIDSVNKVSSIVEGVVVKHA